MAETFYITTPIYYANSLPHLGHLYTTIVADTIRRYKRQRGFDTYFLTGTDEHGVNIQRAAEKNGRSPKEQVDLIAGELKQMFAAFGLDRAHGGYDIFMRTTEPFHYAGAQQFWLDIAKNKTPKGNSTIYKGFYEGWFCAPCAEFKTEEQYVIPEGSDEPHCPIHERPLDKVSEESYFFRLSDYQEFLIELLASEPQRVRPEARRNEVLSFLHGGLQDLSISRQRSSVSWGIPVPGDDGHVMYVWLDALSNYITALGYGSDDTEVFEKYWQDVTHLVGKDILRFHTVYWFSFLHAAGLKLPSTVFAHGMWLDANGRKMGKTIGNTIEVDVLLKHFQVDSVRYFVLRDMVFGQDGKFGYENLIDRANADLASGLGNLASRTLSMIAKYRDGKIPAHSTTDADGYASAVLAAQGDFVRHFDDLELSQAIEAAWSIISAADKMISDAKPWVLAKDAACESELNDVLYRAAETLRWLCVMLYPSIPNSAAAIAERLGLLGAIEKVDPSALQWGGLNPGTAIAEGEPVFPRIDKVKVMNEINEQKEMPETATAAPEQETAAAETPAESAEDAFITIDDFLKVDLRVGEIKVAERIPKADKLLRFEVDLGEEAPRQILAGLAEYYEPEKLIGRKVVVVANLKPRKMRGLESQGMICAASLEDNTGPSPALAAFLEDVEIGARLK
ncbi:MAG: methionyl-tRNA synthetase/methionyl-tRNA synthetase subunit beta [Acidobacteria bacterium OLB17]|nr:MAG: methionyl-tRNA synthetase/methionyl-tRNA synthetase subunit beta [Acidobacteria bacterium OLB17]MCZ2389546.1 methionine--tRNA ligase [Acidobacteriota bacterium]